MALNQVLRRAMTGIKNIYLLRNLQFNRAAIYNKCNISIRAYINKIGYKIRFLTEKLLKHSSALKTVDRGSRINQI